jgi:hypothetical protein
MSWYKRKDKGEGIFVMYFYSQQNWACLCLTVELWFGVRLLHSMHVNSGKY